MQSFYRQIFCIEIKCHKMTNDGEPQKLLDLSDTVSSLLKQTKNSGKHAVVDVSVSQHVKCELLILLFISEQRQSMRDLVWSESAG